ncbi:MAG: hypothetical protein WBN83_04730, partial [Desulfoprunum sp.]|uniref:hypothetical protein n=1 Tax=Desulfoprunum sp. TaxID=2020866 RepID=UPI003C73D611
FEMTAGAASRPSPYRGQPDFSLALEQRGQRLGLCPTWNNETSRFARNDSGGGISVFTLSGIFPQSAWLLYKSLNALFFC